MLEQCRVGGEQRACVAFGLEDPGADVEFVRAHAQDGVVEFTGELQGPPIGACRDDFVYARLRIRRRRFRNKGCGAAGSVDADIDSRIAQAVVAIRALDTRQGNALRSGRPVALPGQFQRAGVHRFLEYVRLHDFIDQTPLLRALAAHPFNNGAEDIGAVVADLAFIGYTSETAGAGQHTQQRHFGQRDGRRAVVDQIDFIARERHFISAAGARAVDRCEEFDTRVARRIFYTVARLVGELAEVDLPRML